MREYDFDTIEKKWQQRWEENNSFHAIDFSDKPKFFVLSEFFGPSGKGIHLGHIKCFTPTEIIARYMRLRGYNVLYPAGWDAFGLPTENYAIKTGEQPAKVTERNENIFRIQLKRMGYSFDWSREIGTSDEDYYKWTQWIFLKLFHHGLAYKTDGIVNFCPQCKTVLSNEDSQGGVCDRCNGQVVNEKRSVWYLRMRSYSDKMLAAIDDIDMKESLKETQYNWIGKSFGAKISFSLSLANEKISVFTTRPDTIFGVTFLVVAPEHAITANPNIKNSEQISNYRRMALAKTTIERSSNKEKTGVLIEGIMAINPFTNEEIPIYAADYVTMGYGTGAIMAVPAHDERDYMFAQKFGIAIRQVIAGGDISVAAYTGDGIHINSDFLNELNVHEAIHLMIKEIEDRMIGHGMVNYKMQDWPFNRQRYWGEPFPIVICDTCGFVPINESDLPLKLPVTSDFAPDNSGNSPLSKIQSFINCTCPTCGMPAKRETDTMPNWAGSSWYWLRFIDPKNNQAFASREKLNYWGAVDLYTGGIEHVTRHMLYASFWHNFLYDIGEVPHQLPFKRRMCNGLILDSSGRKMSKSSGNAIDPIDVVKVHGADIFRLHVMFIGEYEQNTLWSMESIAGIKRFINSVWGLQEMVRNDDTISSEHEYNLHFLLKRYTDTLYDFSSGKKQYVDHNDFKFNTIISAMMTFINKIKADKWITREEFRQFLIMLNPFAPHITSELYEIILGGDIMNETFPSYDESKLVSSEINLPIQVNGKLKAVVDIPADLSEDEVMQIALKLVSHNMEDVKKVIFKKNKIINLII